MTQALALTDVGFSYGGGSALLKGVNLQLEAGQIAVLMGSSGSGKSTLLKLMTGFLAPYSGRISVLGQDIAQLDAKGWEQLRQKMGYLFQQAALFTDLSVFENVAFGLRAHRDVSEAELAVLVEEALHSVGLSALAQRMPSEISGGQARRVALARAMVRQPQLLLYDEPFAGLDPVSLAVIARLIREQGQRLGAASLVVTHDVAESLAVADYAYFLVGGVMRFAGTPEELKACDDPWIEQFIAGRADGPVPFHVAS